MLSRSDPASHFTQRRAVDGLDDTAGEQPQHESAGIEFEQGSHTSGQAMGISVKPKIAVEQVLQGVVGGVADMGHGVDNEPRLPLGGKNIAGVQITAEQHPAIAAGGQLPEQCDSLSGQARVYTAHASCCIRIELVGPLITHRLQRGKVVPRRRLPPQATQKPGHHDVLFWFGIDCP
jgi:hypothetical protein